MASHLFLLLTEKEIVSEMDLLSCYLNILKFLSGSHCQQNPSGRATCNRIRMTAPCKGLVNNKKINVMYQNSLNTIVLSLF